LAIKRLFTIVKKEIINQNTMIIVPRRLGMIKNCLV